MAIPVSYPSNHIEENVRRMLLGKKQIRLSAEGDDFDDWQRFRARLDRLRDDRI